VLVPTRRLTRSCTALPRGFDDGNWHWWVHCRSGRVQWRFQASKRRAAKAARPIHGSEHGDGVLESVPLNSASHGFAPPRRLFTKALARLPFGRRARSSFGRMRHRFLGGRYLGGDELRIAGQAIKETRKNDIGRGHCWMTATPIETSSLRRSHPRPLSRRSIEGISSARRPAFEVSAVGAWGVTTGIVELCCRPECFLSDFDLIRLSAWANALKLLEWWR
jgi:hypothetical protein